MWVRGLKPTGYNSLNLSGVSHPMWVRGLKLFYVDGKLVDVEVAPHVGAWIETQPPNPGIIQLQVAPHVGAWIETLCWPASEI